MAGKVKGFVKDNASELATLGVSTLFGGNAGRALGSYMQEKELEKRKKNAGDIGQRMEDLKKFRPELQLDTPDYSSYTDIMKAEAEAAKARMRTAEYAKATAAGRPETDAMMREENRRTTANTVAQATNTMGSASDTLAALAIADAQERAGNRGISTQSAAQVEANKRSAESAYQQAVQTQAQAAQNYGNSMFAADQATYNAKNMNEQLMFQINQLDPYTQALMDERAIQEMIDAAKGMTTESIASVADSFKAKKQAKADTIIKLLPTLLGA